MSHQTIDYHDCLVTLERGRRANGWGAEDDRASRAARWLAGIGAILPVAAILITLGRKL